MPTAPRQYKPPGAPSRADAERLWMSRRDGRHKLYNMKEWRGKNGIRKRRLDEEPLCRICLQEGEYIDGVWHQKLTPATEVDHIEPHHGDIGKFLDYDNTQSLCKIHHSRKTIGEAHGIK